MLSQEEFDFIQKHREGDPRILALKTHGQFPDSMGFLLDQIKIRQKLFKKLPSWSQHQNVLFSSLLSYEQCSSELTARYKSSLVSGRTCLDISGGIGVDSVALSEVFEQVTHLEHNALTSQCAAHNFGVLGRNIEAIQADGIHYLQSSMKAYDLIYIDPDRRPETSRVYDLSDSLPNLPEHLDFLRSRSSKILLKASPMCDIPLTLENLKNVSEIHVVSHKNECKEVLFLMDHNYLGSPKLTAVELESPYKISLDYSETKVHKAPQNALGYVYDPMVCFRKAGLSWKLAQNYELAPLNQEGTLLTGDQLQIGFEGRIFKVIDTLPFDRKKLKKAGYTKANVIARGFHINAQEIAKKMQIQDGGNLFLIPQFGQGGKSELVVCERSDL